METGSLIPPPKGMKDPGNEDIIIGMEDGRYKNTKRESINCRLQVLGHELQDRISFIHNRNARAFFCCDVFMEKKGVS